MGINSRQPKQTYRFQQRQHFLEGGLCPPINLLSGKEIVPTYCPRVRSFSGVPNLWAFRLRFSFCRSRQRLSSKDTLERVITIHGDEHLEDQVRFAFKFVGTGRACMSKAPVGGITPQCNAHPSLDILTY
jgi:hypothetical protein